MNQTTIANKNNYSINHGITVYSVSVQPGNTKVILNTSSHSRNMQYTLTVNNVKDVAGNLIDPQYHTAKYSLKNQSGVNVDQVIAHWIQNYRPENTVDGVADTNSESRWQGVSGLPDSIVFDLGKKVSVDETRFSFYMWDQGVVFNYSVMASTDGNNWTPLVSNESSFSQEWTIADFASTEARYIKLVTLTCNQSQNAGLWEAQIFGPDGTTGVETIGQVPSVFGLEQNYPNPFNPTTTIKFNIPSDQNVKIDIYNAIGQLVKELINQYFTSGSYSISFNAADLPSGIYIYRLEAGSFTDSKKMILMK